MLDAGDRSSPDDARDVFRSLFPGLKVVVKNVYELKRKPGEENEDTPAPPTRAGRCVFHLSVS